MVESRGRGFKPHRRHCVMSLSKNINPSLVLVLPRKTCPFIIERLLMGCKESNQTKTKAVGGGTAGPDMAGPLLRAKKVITGVWK